MRSGTRFAVASVLAALSARAAFSEDGTPKPAPADPAKLVADLCAEDAAVRRKAAYALWQAGADAKDAVVPLAKALRDADPYVRTTAAKALSKHSDMTSAATNLGEALVGGAPDVRLDAAKLLMRANLPDRPFEALTKGLADPDPEVRANAAAALEWAGNLGKSAAPALLRCVTEDEDPRVRRWAALALATIDGEQLVAPMVEALASEDAAVRADAAGILSNAGRAAAGAARPLGRALSDPSPAVRAAAASALGAIGPAAELDRVLLALDDPIPEVRAAALAALNQPGSDGMEKAFPRLAKLLDSKDAATRSAAATALASMDPLQSIARLTELARTDPEPTVRQAAAFALQNSGPLLPDASIPVLVAALDDPDSGVRMAAYSAVIRIGRRASAAAPRLLALGAAGDGEPFSRQLALHALPAVGIPAEDAVSVLRGALSAEAPMVRLASATVLAEYGAAAAPAAPELAARVSGDSDENVRAAAALTLGKIGPGAAGAAAALRAVRDDAPFLVRVHAAFALASVSPEDAPKAVDRLVGLISGDRWLGKVPVTDLGLLGATARPAAGTLVQLLRKPASEGWETPAAVALCRIGGDGADEALAKLLAGATKSDAAAPNRQVSALFALAELPALAEKTLPALTVALTAEDATVRAWAARALAMLGPAAAPAVPALEKAAKDPVSAVRRAAAEALVRVR